MHGYFNVIFFNMMVSYANFIEWDTDITVI